jgi:predicted phosphodiesterase
MTKVLVIADTHNKLPPIICELARGAEEIWHLGDVCDDWIVDELRALGPPLTLVRGNCDSNYQWPLVCDLTRNGIRRANQSIATFCSMAIPMCRATRRLAGFAF